MPNWLELSITSMLSPRQRGHARILRFSIEDVRTIIITVCDVLDFWSVKQSHCFILYYVLYRRNRDHERAPMLRINDIQSIAQSSASVSSTNRTYLNCHYSGIGHRQTIAFVLHSFFRQILHVFKTTTTAAELCPDRSFRSSMMERCNNELNTKRSIVHHTIQTGDKIASKRSSAASTERRMRSSRPDCYKYVRIVWW